MIGRLDSSTALLTLWRVWPPAVLLIAVSLTQIVLAHTSDLSPWKGGGFGMFATVDGTAFRYVRIFVEAPDRSEEIDIAPSQAVLAARAKLFPSDTKLLSLAKAVSAREKRYNRTIQTVKIEVRRTEFNEMIEATDRPFRAFTWSVDGSSDTSR